MACDTCGKLSDSLASLSDYVQKFLPYKYQKAQVCPDCEKKLNDELDKWRSIAWQKCALKLVLMIDEEKSK